MKEVFRRTYKKFLTRPLDDAFELDHDGLYCIEIVSSARSWWQNTKTGRSFLKKDSTTFLLDKKNFPTEKRKLLANDLWNGNVLKGHDKMACVITFLEKGAHLFLFPVHGAPFLDYLAVYAIENQNVEYKNLQAGIRDRTPWITFLFRESAALSSLSVIAKAEKQKRDDEDISIFVDGVVIKNESKKAHRDWYWCGKILNGKAKTFQKDFSENNTPMRIDFAADEGPAIEKLSLNFFHHDPLRLRGTVALHADIQQTDFARLREGPHLVANEIAKLRNGDRVEILEERVIGDWIESRSYIWHRIRWNDTSGFIHSSFIEINVSEREQVIRRIKEEARAVGFDSDLAVALAGCESLYKPFAASRPFEEKDEEGSPIAARGIFQLTAIAVQQLHQNSGIYYYDVKDSFNTLQNMAGGVRYAAWLYDAYYKGTTQAEKKFIAAYNAGQRFIPSKGALTYEHIPTDEKRQEAQRHVRCVLERKRRKTKKNILSILLIFTLVGPVGTSALRYADENDFFEPVVSAREALLADISSFPAHVVDEESGQLIFFDSNKNEAGRIPLHQLQFESSADIQMNEHASPFVSLGTDVVEYPAKTFYFSATSSLLCGNDNCGWALFRYSANSGIVERISMDGLSSGLRLSVSPTGSYLAVFSFYAAGFCRGKAFIGLLNLKNLHYAPIEGFEDDDYTASYIQTARWVSDLEMEFTVNHGCGTRDDNRSRDRVYRYNFFDKNVRLIHETYYSSGG
ncbi:transglycosylase SLT domain-containing protein [Candidatus Uhrbacteria bacterium]|nr:transglycosylase SLT domain-containing protein [Candidatus Uhrbacteria bacterium]